MNTVVVDAEIAGCEGLAVRIEDGRITALDATSRIDRRGADVVDAAGGALLPGLHDHHLHLLALAARSTSIDLADVPAAADVDARLRREVRAIVAVAPAGSAPSATTSIATGRWTAVVSMRSVATCRYGCSTAVACRGWSRRPGSWRWDSRWPPVAGVAEDPSSDGRVGFEAEGPAEPGVERDAGGVATGWLHRLDGWMAVRVGRVTPDLGSIGVPPRRLRHHRGHRHDAGAR